MDASVPIFQQTLGSRGLDVLPVGETDFEGDLQRIEGKGHPPGVSDRQCCVAPVGAGISK